MPSSTILVTGANGFIGTSLVRSLCNAGYTVRATVRTARAELALRNDVQIKHQSHLSLYNLGELDETTNWLPVLDGVDCIIHCAARAHILRETHPNPEEAFRRSNAWVTEHLAKQAASCGVKRFIFLSSIGVLGHNSHKTPFTDDTAPNPKVAYARAKWEAEQALHRLPHHIDYVIIRPPLVYGQDAKGNFGKLFTVIQTGIPLPFGAIRNKRHFLGIDNLVHFIMTCVAHPNPIRDTFLIADKAALSTTELLNRLSQVFNKRMILIPIPQALLQCLLLLLGQKKIAGQLLGNLEIDAHKARTILHWEPPYTLIEQLKS
jgi:nucleoside-diphosphate-sugar epimerase